MIGTAELIIIFCVVLVLFGGKKLPELARSLGVGIREFKRAVSGAEDETPPVPPSRKGELDQDGEPVVIIVEPESRDKK